MDQTITRICGLLQSPDLMRRYAAAIMLAEFAPRDAAVVRALGECLAEANPTLTNYVLQALEAIGSDAAAPYVMPLLNAEDTETKLRAIAIVAKAGRDVIPEIQRNLLQAPRQHKFVLIDLLARIHTREAFAVVLELLFDSDFDVVKEACAAVQRHIGSAPTKARKVLGRQVAAFMKSAKAQERERVMTSCLLLLGAIGDPEARQVLLRYSRPGTSAYMRRHALAGLKGLEFKGAAAKSLARQLLEYIEEPDADVARVALDLLRNLPSKQSAAQWDRLLKSVHAPVRAAAARVIADADDAASNRRLLALLGHEDQDVQEIAAGALSAHKQGTKLLLETLTRETNPEAAWRLAKILKPHSEGVDARVRKRFVALAARELQANRERAKPLLYFLRNVDAKACDGVLLAAGMKFRREKKWPLAVDCLRRLVGTESFDDATRYALGVCDLKISSKDPAPQLRAQDHALRVFQSLLNSPGFKLLEQLKKESSLDAADLYYVGFHFSEAPGGERDFGEALLKHVAAKWPKSAEGKAARNKVGLAQPKPKPKAARRKR